MQRMLDENRTDPFGIEKAQDSIHRPGVHLHERVGNRATRDEAHEPVEDGGAPPDSDPPGAQAPGIIGKDEVNCADASGLKTAEEIHQDSFTAFRLNMLEDDEGVDQVESERGVRFELIDREKLHICDAARGRIAFGFDQHAGSDVDSGYMGDLLSERDGDATDATSIIESPQGNEVGTQTLTNDS